MYYSTRHCCIQSAILFPRKMNRRCLVKWIVDGVKYLYALCNAKKFGSDAFLGVVNVTATNGLRKSQYFFDRSRCIEMFESKLKLEWQFNIALIHCRPHMLSKWRWRSQWWRCGRERQHNTAKILPIHHTQIDSALHSARRMQLNTKNRPKSNCRH